MLMVARIAKAEHRQQMVQGIDGERMQVARRQVRRQVVEQPAARARMEARTRMEPARMEARTRMEPARSAIAASRQSEKVLVL